MFGHGEPHHYFQSGMMSPPSHVCSLHTSDNIMLFQLYCGDQINDISRCNILLVQAYGSSRQYDALGMQYVHAFMKWHCVSLGSIDP